MIASTRRGLATFEVSVKRAVLQGGSPEGVRV